MVVDHWQEWVPDRQVHRARRPLVVVGRGASMRVTQQVVDMLGGASHVVFLTDRIGHRVALQAADPSIPHAFPFKLYQHSKMPTLSSEGFFRWAGISRETRREFPVEECGENRVCFRLEPSDSDGEFEEFTLKGVAFIHQSPNASISRSGHMTLNQPAVRLLGEPEQVVLLYNEARRLIGIRPAADELHARPLRKVTGQRTWALAVEGFLKQFGIPHETGRSFELHMEEAVMVIDLNRPKSPKRGTQSG